MINNQETERIKKSIKVVEGFSAVLSAGIAAYEGGVKSYIINNLSNKSNIPVVFIEFVFFLLAFYLSTYFASSIYEFYLNQRSKLDGWWIYGFHIEELSADGINKEQKLVVGRFRLLHTIGGLSIKMKGTSLYVNEVGNSYKLKTRGTWDPIEIINIDNGSELWVLYHFQIIQTREYYDGIMKFVDSQNRSLISDPTAKGFKELLAKWFSFTHNKYRNQFIGTVLDISNKQLTFSNAFAEKMPKFISSGEEVNKIIIENASSIYSYLSK